MSLLTHPERQLMQHLRGAGWVRSIAFPSSSKVIANLLGKGWIKQRGAGVELAFHLTEQGLTAMKAQVRA
jgi:hypothetical protein